MDDSRLEITVWASAHAGPRLTAAELARAAGVPERVLERLVQRRLVEPVAADGTFALASLVRLRRMLRLHQELEVSLFAASVMVDLLERVDRLDAELQRLRGAG